MLPINSASPTIMHIDLNSCFATIEQQAYPCLRGKPIVIAAYPTNGGCVLAPSIEAKKLGVKVGMTVRDARALCPTIIVRDPDPVMVRHVHRQFKSVVSNYAASVVPASIDELILNFTGTVAESRGLETIGQAIKHDIRTHIGEWLSCSIGIGTNRFLAKVGAGLQKPDGLVTITHKNLTPIYKTLTLTELPGINTRYQARLLAAGITSPIEFFEASIQTLKHTVFKSICGYYWFMRLRGWEIDVFDSSRKSFGQSYALSKQTDDKKELSRLIMKLTEKMGRRLRADGFEAYGNHLSMLYTDGTYWHHGHKFPRATGISPELYRRTMLLFAKTQAKTVRTLAVSCFDLIKQERNQMTLFDDGDEKSEKLQSAVDHINDRFGEFVMTPALMMGMDDLILDRIAFGGVRDLEELYSSVHSPSTI